jgi:glutathione synthase/RimK-type ligase-like ATP-grasp enzyme
MSRLLVRLATCRHLPEPDPDAGPLERALAATDVDASWAAWDDPDVDWDAPIPTLLRTTWNYAEHPVAFRAWCARVDAAAPLMNPRAVIEPNMHKGYLLALAARGVPVAPTTLVPAGAAAPLAARTGQVVIKPAISAGSRGAQAFDLDDAAGRIAAAAHLEAWRASDMLIQPFIDSVRTSGERSLVFLDGELSHAIRKEPRFAGQPERVSGPHPIAPDERTVAEAALAPVRAQILYGRVDLARDHRGQPMVMELELIEPSLFLNLGGAAAGARLAEAIAAWARAARR